MYLVSSIAIMMMGLASISGAESTLLFNEVEVITPYINEKYNLIKRLLP